MKRIILTSFLVFMTLNFFAQSDTVSKRLDCGIEIISFLMPEVKNESITKTEQNISVGANIIVNYNFTKKLAVSSGIGFYTGQYQRKFTYGIYGHRFVEFMLPLMVQYSTNKNKHNISYYTKAGISTNFILNKSRNNESIILVEEDILKNEWDVSLPVSIGIRYHLNNNTRLFFCVNSVISAYWVFYYGASIGILFV